MTEALEVRPARVTSTASLCVYRLRPLLPMVASWNSHPDHREGQPKGYMSHEVTAPRGVGPSAGQYLGGLGVEEAAARGGGEAEDAGGEQCDGGGFGYGGGVAGVDDQGGCGGVAEGGIAAQIVGSGQEGGLEGEAGEELSAVEVQVTVGGEVVYAEVEWTVVRDIGRGIVEGDGERGGASGGEGGGHGVDIEIVGIGVVLDGGVDGEGVGGAACEGQGEGVGVGCYGCKRDGEGEDDGETNKGFDGGSSVGQTCSMLCSTPGGSARLPPRRNGQNLPDMMGLRSRGRGL